jgi:hypothetical protein
MLARELDNFGRVAGDGRAASLPASAYSSPDTGAALRK